MSAPSPTQAPLAAEVEAQSPAERMIAQARRVIDRQPERAQGYGALAQGLARRARETGAPAYYDQADTALREALRRDPDDFEAQKIHVWILLGRHRFAEALDAALALQKRTLDDLAVYGFLVDAYAELGRYEEAEAAAQWMLDLRPGNVPALTRTAYLRELFGDVEGAAELMLAAYHALPEAEREERAWTLTQLAQLALAEGKIADANELARQALAWFPDYHYALAALAAVRIAQGKHAEAVELLQRRYALAPHPENLYALAEALDAAGRAGAARRAFEDFERAAQAEAERWDNANRELIFYLADRADRPVDALRVAQIEFGRRRDVHTLDAYGWALHRNGRHAEGRMYVEQALAVGIQDPRMFYHAGVIAARLGDVESAKRHLHNAVERARVPGLAAAAERTLAELEAIDPRE